MSTLRVLDLRGEPREVGRQHGEQAGELVRRGLWSWRSFLEDETGAPLERYVEEFLEATGFTDVIERETPDLLDEVRGIAAGAEVDERVLLAFQCMDEEWWFRAERGHRDNHHCTSFGLRVEASRDGVIIGQNMDLPAHLDGTQVLLRIAERDGLPAQVILSPAGMLGACGMNAAPVGICCNSLTALNHHSAALPVAFVLRRVLQETSASAAADLVRRTRHASPQNYVIGDSETIIDLEVSSGAVVEYAAADPVVVHSNHALANRDERPEVAPAIRLATSGRSVERLRHVEDELPAGRRHGVEDAQRALSDTTVPVCVSRGRRRGSVTFGSVVWRLSRPAEAFVAPGPPDEEAYQRVPVGAAAIIGRP